MCFAVIAICNVMNLNLLVMYMTLSTSCLMSVDKTSRSQSHIITVGDI